MSYLEVMDYHRVRIGCAGLELYNSSNEISLGYIGDHTLKV